MHKRKNVTPREVAPLLLTIPQVATTLGVSKSKVYALMNTKGLPYVKLGEVKRVPLTKLQRWLEQQEQSA
jgi:excisionase family DNA binding protein